jgi:hypothetical protein
VRRAYGPEEWQPGCAAFSSPSWCLSPRPRAATWPAWSSTQSCKRQRDARRAGAAGPSPLDPEMRFSLLLMDHRQRDVGFGKGFDPGVWVTEDGLIHADAPEAARLIVENKRGASVYRYRKSDASAVFSGLRKNPCHPPRLAGRVFRGRPTRGQIPKGAGSAVESNGDRTGPLRPDANAQSASPPRRSTQDRSLNVRRREHGNVDNRW